MLEGQVWVRKARPARRHSAPRRCLYQKAGIGPQKTCILMVKALQMRSEELQTWWPSLGIRTEKQESTKGAYLGCKKLSFKLKLSV